MVKISSALSLSRLRRAAVGSVILCLFIVPGLFLLYGGLAGAIGGVAVICAFAVIQLPLFVVLRRFRIMPSVSFGLPPVSDASNAHEELEPTGDSE